MSENRRFEWDVLLEREPEKPPIRTETRVESPQIPIEFEPYFDDMDAPQDLEEQQTVAMPKVPEKPERNRQVEAQIQVEPPAPKRQQQAKPQTETRQKHQGMNILEGNIAPNQLVNAFILSEIFGKPKGLRRGGRR